MKYRDAKNNDEAQSNGYFLGLRFILYYRNLRRWCHEIEMKNVKNSFNYWFFVFLFKIFFMSVITTMFIFVFMVSLFIIMAINGWGKMSALLADNKKNDIIVEAYDFETDEISQSYEKEDGYRSGPEGYGYYVDDLRIGIDKESED